MTGANLTAQISAELVQYPDVSEDHICFTFGNDLWLVDKHGGDAMKLSSPDGRETNPKFSPDGKTVAFEANIDGNNDLYTISIKGGVPQRVTGHGMGEYIMDWYADGNHILFSSSMESGKQRWVQFYKVDAAGGLPDKLPVELGGFASISKDGKWLAFTDKTRVTRTWKRYRGGTAPDIFLMNLETLESKNITSNDANDEIPMWGDGKIYYMSDQGPALRNNIWVYDLDSEEHTQLTFFKEFDIHYPSIGPSEIVFEAGGKIQLLNLSDNSVSTVEINAVGDFNRLKPSLKNVSNNIFTSQISPDGQRAVMEARGDIFTLPKEKGVVRNITQSSGSAERHPAWSPNGKYIAYFSDQQGEYDVYIHEVKTGDVKKVSDLGPGYRYNIFWAPNSEKLSFVDQTMTFYELDINTGETTRIDQDGRLFEGALRGFRVSYSPDSRYIAYTKTGDNGNNSIYIFDTDEKIIHRVTSGFYDDNTASFGKDGKYLYLSTNRRISPVYSDFDNSWIYPNATQLAVITLSDETASPLAPENDEVTIEEEEEDEDNGDEDEEETEDDEDSEEEEDEDEGTVISFNEMERRLEILPVSGGNIGGVNGLSNKVLFIKVPNSGSGGGSPKLMYYDLEEKESKTVISDIWGYNVAHDGKHLLVRGAQGFSIIEIGPDKKMEDMVPTKDMASFVNPRDEWHQIFNDVWRFERDFFYDENMHGVDWDAMKTKYGDLIDQAMSRYDVNFIIGELIGELNASHTYRGGGDGDNASRRSVGYLGVDWSKDNGEFKIERIVKGAIWDNEVRSPLDMAGVDINEGDYILAVNGVRLNNYTDPWIAFTGLANETVELTVNDTPTVEEARSVLVKTLRSETRLRNLEWIEKNRAMVDELSDGKIGYIYVPSTGIDGQNELIRMFYAQWDKEGLIIDERFNNGGQIPDRFIELLDRKPLAYWDVRDGTNWQWPPVAHFGPKAMLINGWSGSGGDAFPDYFRKSGLGPLIGSRTWGGLIGISGAPTLIDGGVVTVPTFRMYDPNGNWFKEGHGVDPDIEVMEDPEELAKGNDPQIERAVKEIMKEINSNGPIHPSVPEAEDRSK